MYPPVQQNPSPWVVLILIVMCMALVLGILLYREFIENPAESAVQATYAPLYATKTADAYSIIATPHAQAMQATQTAQVLQALVEQIPLEQTVTAIAFEAMLADQDRKSTAQAKLNEYVNGQLQAGATQTMIAAALDNNTNHGKAERAKDWMLIGLLGLGSAGLLTFLTISIWPQVRRLLGA